MKITVCKEVDMTEEQQEIYDKGFDDGVKSVRIRDAERKAELRKDFVLKEIFMWLGVVTFFVFLFLILKDIML